MKNLILILLLIHSGVICFAQNKENPLHPISYFNYIKYSNLRIKSVKTTTSYTEVVFLYTNNEYKVDGWFNINKNSYLRDSETGLKYKLQKVKNVPYSPEKKYIDYKDEAEFTLYFEKLDKACRVFDFIEGEKFGDGFTLENIRLEANQLKYQGYIDEIVNYIPLTILLTLREGSLFEFEYLYNYYLKLSESGSADYSDFVKRSNQNDGSNPKKDIYKFNYKGSNIFLLVNSETKDNVQVIIELEDSFEYTRFWYNLRKIHFLKDNGNGTWSLPDKIFSVISPIKKNKMVSWIVL